MAATSKKVTRKGASSSKTGTKPHTASNTSARDTSAPWTFLTNHAHVLIVLHSEPDLVLREVASRVGITERAVQRIVQELEEEAYLTRERIGRCNHYQITSGRHLRHPVESHCTIDQVLKLICKTSVSKRRRS